MILLDTNVLSELIRPKPDERVREWLDSLDAATVRTTAITAAELQYGVARMPAGKHKERLSEAIRGLMEEDLGGRIEPFDANAATHYATLVGERERAGHPISMADAQIAAISRELGATLATRHTNDFQNTGIELVDPWQNNDQTP